jgi:hypothetical protein
MGQHIQTLRFNAQVNHSKDFFNTPCVPVLTKGGGAFEGTTA